MASENNIPENDLDLLLARSLGKSLDSLSDFTKLDNKLVDQLVEFKNIELSSYDIQSPDSSSIWAAIQKETQPKTNVIPLFQRPIAYTWAAAAVLIIAAFIGFYWVSVNTTPLLIAQSDSTISTVVLDDGTEVTLRPYSQLFEIAETDNERNYSLIGEAFFNVTSDPDRPFNVEAGEGTITVLGTKFNLSTWADKTTIYLEEGRVQFSSEEFSVILEPGQASEIINGNISNPLSVEIDNYTDWLSNTIVFNSSLPADVVAEIGQHYNITIDITQLNDESALQGTLQLGSIGQTIEDLGLVLGGTFRKVSDNEFIFIAIALD